MVNQLMIKWFIKLMIILMINDSWWLMVSDLLMVVSNG